MFSYSEIMSKIDKFQINGRASKACAKVNMAVPLSKKITCYGLSGKRVLLISQYKLMRTLLVKILEHFGAVIALADSAITGIRAVRHGRETGELIEIVIVDMEDPVSILSYLKQESGRESQQVLVLSKALSGEEIKILVKQNMDGLLLKPFGISDFSDVLVGMLEKNNG